MKKIFGCGITARRNRSKIDFGKLTLTIYGIDTISILEDLLPMIEYTFVHQYAYKLYFRMINEYKIPKKYVFGTKRLAR